VSFHEQNFSARFGAMGDEAEARFEETYLKGWVRFGLNRPPLKMSSLPMRLRHMPDYLTSDGFVEVKGIGRDETLKIKVDEYNCMNFWHQLFPMTVFVWSSHRKAIANISLGEVSALINNGDAQLQKFHDGKAYFAVDADRLHWVPLATKAAA
jgi:hypothetical protein